MFERISFQLKPIQQEAVWDGVLTQESMWAYPREHSAKQQMRQCYANIEKSKKVSKKLATRLKKEFKKEDMYAKMVAALIDESEFDVESWLTGLNIEEIE